MWKLFLDDLRKLDHGFILARNCKEAEDLINEKGFPSVISFDHDLGENEPTGYDFVNLIIEKVLDGEWEIPGEFKFYVHSDNPVGAKNISGTFNSFLRHIDHEYQLKVLTPYSNRR